MQTPAMDTGESGSILAAVLERLPSSGAPAWNLRLGTEALLISLVSIFVARYLDVPEAGLFAVALASGALVPRVNSVLSINRARVWSETLPWGSLIAGGRLYRGGAGRGRSANLASILSAICVFAGMFLGFLIVALVSDVSELEEDFTFILGVGQFNSQETLTPERFALGTAVFHHNFLVLTAFALLAFLYRSLGTMIALGWNASTWAIILVILTSTGVGGSSSPVLHVLIVIVSIMPHLVFEAAAYIVGALSAIFLSRGITLYGLTDLRLRRVLVAVLVLAVLSLVLLLVGGLLEVNYAPRVLGLL